MRVYDDSMVGGARGRKDLDPATEDMEEGGGAMEEVPKDEDDSEEALKKARERDEFKDGEGNIFT